MRGREKGGKEGGCAGKKEEGFSQRECPRALQSGILKSHLSRKKQTSYQLAHHGSLLPETMVPQT